MKIPSPRGPSDKENGHDGIANECKTNPVTFQDMPYEVIKVIIEHTNPGDRYNLLFTCKNIAMVAGEMLCDGRMVAWRGHYGLSTSQDRAIGISELFAGIENTHSTKEKPFGRDLKLRFLRFITYLNLESYSKAKFDESAVILIIKALRELRDKGIEPFPNLVSVELGASPLSPPRAPELQREFDLTLVSLCRPKQVIVKSGYGFLELRSDNIPYCDLKFAGGHLPVEVLHQPFSFHIIPMACYGTRNRVNPPRTVTDSVEKSAEYVLRVLHQTHPELNDIKRKHYPEDQLEKRDKTTWAFSWELSRINGLPWAHHDVSKVRDAVLKELPEMRDRIYFSPRKSLASGWAQIINCGQ
ncbi:hypothetical protein CNAG_05717 [Cryptococcus neoformans var. grubii H99]|uniref:F-box domain-containing protein n=1 Tax=Cryptococcus neoformans (strain H99 / ATCC 208821 / CBS 10515 / FGSC 9487) TaxID=235443 RepID=J9VWF7_CRYN9|nr:hypothetical protein CNAG_05717 [Cryptococcus neoformans var. grubii H99]AFR96035.2 hypothetical protein CNAG_05717 [Cryptococcus neoformans var. grubii H99]AUB25901.1 hypothetical protein CKF44_05717 [Cryptococcus neoformans var. grubii]|eukprot:XP_012050347.1 hypothetical protein CNAG_05717 [Cryptococcus neoformans var. grubii H99]